MKNIALVLAFIMLICFIGLIFQLLMVQIDGTYMFNLEAFVPKLCQLVQDSGEDEGAEGLRSAGLQGLSSMVCLSISTIYIYTKLVKE